MASRRVLGKLQIEYPNPKRKSVSEEQFRRSLAYVSGCDWWFSHCRSALCPSTRGEPLSSEGMLIEAIQSLESIATFLVPKQYGAQSHLQ